MVWTCGRGAGGVSVVQRGCTNEGQQTTAKAWRCAANRTHLRDGGTKAAALHLGLGGDVWFHVSLNILGLLSVHVLATPSCRARVRSLPVHWARRVDVTLHFREGRSLLLVARRRARGVHRIGRGGVTLRLLLVLGVVAAHDDCSTAKGTSSCCAVKTELEGMASTDRCSGWSIDRCTLPVPRLTPQKLALS